MAQIEDNGELFRIATVVTPVANGKAKLLFDGETIISNKYYTVLYPQSNYIYSNNRVLCVRVSGSWVVIGAIK